jgi:hypothetical protein
MINASCCCTPIGCDGAVDLKDAILAYDLTLLGCVITGSLAPQIAVTGASIEYTQVNFDRGCHNYDCCIACGESIFNCTNFCEPPFKKRIIQCLAIHEKNRRYIPGTASTSYCADCQNAPEFDCEGCEGFLSTSFTSSGLNSRSSITPIFTPFSCDSDLATKYLIATKVETIVTGNKTVVMSKILTVGVTASSIPNLYPSCVMMTLKFRVTGGITGSCADSVGQTVVYHSVWNGTDTAAEFMAKPMTLHGLLWDYDICPSNHGTDPSALNTCGGYVLDSFKDTECGVCTASEYSIAFTEQSYNTVRVDYECPPNTLYPIIDSEWQPWQNVPTTIQPLL